MAEPARAASRGPDPRQRRRPRGRATDLFDGRLPAKYAELAPRAVTKDDGTDVWLYEGQELPTSASTPCRAAARGVRHRAGRVLDMRAGCCDVDQRVRGHGCGTGARLALLPPSPVLRPALRPHRGTGRRPRDAPGLQRLAHRRLVRGHPGRFIPLALPGDLGPRCSWPRRSAGSRPRAAGPSPSRRTPRARLAEFHRPTGTRSGRRAPTRAPSCACTSASSSQMVVTSVEAPINVMITLQPMNMGAGGADLLWSRVITEFGVRFALRGRDPGGSPTSSSGPTTSTSTTRRGRAATSATACRARCSWTG